MKYLLCAVWLLSLGCSTTPNDPTYQSRNLNPKTGSIIPGLPKPALALVPKARYFTGEITPMITQINPRSAAEKYGFKVGDTVVSLNGEKIYSAVQFDEKIKHAQPLSSIGIRRNGQLQSIKVLLGMDRPRFGANFEPHGIAYVRKTSPFISFMRQKELTAFAETSINEEQTLLHVNVIFNSPAALPQGPVKYTVWDKGTKTKIASGADDHRIPPTTTRVFTKAIKNSKGFKGPIWVAIDFGKKQFRFEFQ